MHSLNTVRSARVYGETECSHTHETLRPSLCPLQAMRNQPPILTSTKQHVVSCSKSEHVVDVPV
jgi:hypothetical protein